MGPTSWYSPDTMAGRVKSSIDRADERVTITFDGAKISAIRGEPVVAALVAAGKIALARSPKFHRPRGPACLRAACDGCLARVDECPNVMTCMVAAREGLAVKTQNTLGSREMDVLRMTDWFFPEGLNHHELFAGVPGVQALMQSFARRVAGLGRLPHEVVMPRPAARREADVVVIGAGPAGMAAATKIASQGRRVDVIDDALEPGGGVRALGQGAKAWAAITDDFRSAMSSGAIAYRASTTAGAFYGDDLLVVGPQGAEVLGARAFVLAPGAHDGVLAFEGNDVPGVMSARAAGWLLARGVLVGARVVVVVAEGGGPFGEDYARSVGETGACQVTLVRGEPVRVGGSLRAKSVVVREDGVERTLKADAVLIDAPRAPAYELCEQAGATLRHEPRGFFAETTDGKIAGKDNVWALGEVVGTAFDPASISAAADAIATRLGA